MICHQLTWVALRLADEPFRLISDASQVLLSLPSWAAELANDIVNDPDPNKMRTIYYALRDRLPDVCCGGSGSGTVASSSSSLR